MNNDSLLFMQDFAGLFGKIIEAIFFHTWKCF